MFKKLERIARKKGIFFIIMCALVSICTGCGDDYSVSSVAYEEDKSADKSEATEVYDEVVSVVDSFMKAWLNRDVETTLTYCTDSVKDKVRDRMKEMDTMINSEVSEGMDICVSSAQMVFNSAGNYIDTIDAEYLYGDPDIQKVCEECCESKYRNAMIYSLPEKAEMISDKEAVVVMDLASKSFATTESSLSDDIIMSLEEIVLEKLMDDSNFIKEEIAKKIVKETIIGYMRDSKRKFEESAEVWDGKATCYLSKENGKWLISKVESEYFTDDYDDEAEEDDYYEDEFEEDDYYNDEFEEDEYQDMYDNTEDDDYDNEMMEQYILPYSDSEYLDETDLGELSAEECRIARNEIYARYGRRFNDEQLQDYFNACSWYEGKIDPEDFSDEVLNEVEKANLQIITEYEKEMGF